MERISNFEFKNKTNNIFYAVLGCDIDYEFNLLSEPVKSDGEFKFVHMANLFFKSRLVIYTNKPIELKKYWETKLGFIPKPIEFKNKLPSLPNTQFSFTFESIEEYQNQLVQSIKKLIKE